MYGLKDVYGIENNIIEHNESIDKSKYYKLVYCKPDFFFFALFPINLKMASISGTGNV